jgi:predicted DNA-binding protein
MRQILFTKPYFLNLTTSVKDRLRERAGELEVTESTLVREAIREKLQPATSQPA